MAKLTDQEINDILASKGFSCSNVNEYQNMDTILHLTCEHGHHIDASIRTVRNANFKCSVCDGQESLGSGINVINPPDKANAYRVVAIDNATEKVGVSVFDNGKLVFWHLYKYSGETIERMAANRLFIEATVINIWKPDMIVYEDIQYQNNVITFKTLAMLLGSSLVSTKLANIRYETVLSKVWRAHFMINGKTRVQQKVQAIEKVKEMYNINVTDDVAEAILLGKYAVDTIRKVAVKKLF